MYQTQYQNHVFPRRDLAHFDLLLPAGVQQIENAVVPDFQKLNRGRHAREARVLLVFSEDFFGGQRLDGRHRERFPGAGLAEHEPVEPVCSGENGESDNILVAPLQTKNESTSS